MVLFLALNVPLLFNTAFDDWTWQTEPKRSASTTTLPRPRRFSRLFNRSAWIIVSRDVAQPDELMEQVAEFGSKLR